MKVIFSKITIHTLQLLIFCSVISLRAQISFEKSVVDLNSDFPLAITDMDNDWDNEVLTVLDNGWLVWGTNPVDTNTFVKIDSLENTGTGNLSWFSLAASDVNNDGKKDVFVGDFKKSKLYISNGSGYIKKLIPDNFFAQAAGFIDVNGDGILDLFVCNDDSVNYLYLGDGTGNFEKDTITFSAHKHSGNYGLVWSDFDGDLDMDLYISKCKGGVFDSTDLRRVNVLFRNEGNGNYTEVAAEYGIADGAQSWSSDFGDIDNDGDMDLIVTNHYSRNRLFEQVNDTFIEITHTSGLEYDNRFDFQSSFIDFNNDGFQDLIFANSDSMALIYQNNGDKTFSAINVDAPIRLRSFAVGDLNYDYFPDIYGSNYEPDSLDEVWFNKGNSNNAFACALQSSVGNPDNIGSILKLYGTWGVQTKEIRAGESYGIQHSQYPVFGIGQNTEIDSLQIYWPDGHKCVVNNVDENMFNFITRDCNVTSTDVGFGSKKYGITKKIDFFPNPANKFIFWNYDSEFSPGKISIYDMNGNLVLSKTAQSGQNKLDISKLSKGKYLITISDNKNSKTLYYQNIMVR